MNDITQHLRKIRQSCDLGPLTGSDLDTYWVDTDDARDPLRSVRDNLRQRLEDREDTKILFYGPGGSGKSTELNKLVKEMDGEYLVVNFSVREEMNLADINSEDIILVMMERLAAIAADAGLDVDTEALEGINDYFSTFTETQKQESKQSVEASAEANVATPPILTGLIKLLAGFKAEVRYEARSETSRVAAIRKRPGDLIAYANLLVNAVRQSLPPGQRLLFIVEDLDKLDIARARQVFVENSLTLVSIHTNIIYTIPIFTFHSPDASILHTRFHSNLSFPMIKVTGPDGLRAEGFEVVREIITRRLGQDALTQEALDTLIEKTGGVLQHAFEVVVGATLLRKASVPLGVEQINHSLQRKKGEFLTEITLPFEPVPGLERREQLYERLKQCLGEQKAGKPCRPSGQAIDQVLLKSCALVEYNGDRWLGVHPLVQEILTEIGWA